MFGFIQNTPVEFIKFNGLSNKCWTKNCCMDRQTNGQQTAHAAIQTDGGAKTIIIIMSPSQNKLLAWTLRYKFISL